MHARIPTGTGWVGKEETRIGFRVLVVSGPRDESGWTDHYLPVFYLIRVGGLGLPCLGRKRYVCLDNFIWAEGLV